MVDNHFEASKISFEQNQPWQDRTIWNMVSAINVHGDNATLLGVVIASLDLQLTQTFCLSILALLINVKLPFQKCGQYLHFLVISMFPVHC